MKGWHKESYRHSLSAKGISTSMSVKSNDELVQAYLMREKMISDKIANDKIRLNNDKVIVWSDTLNLDDSKYTGTIHINLVNGDRIEIQKIIDQYGNPVYTGVIPQLSTEDNPDGFVQMDDDIVKTFFYTNVDNIEDVTRDVI
jgi:hypothetical protein